MMIVLAQRLRQPERPSPSRRRGPHHPSQSPQKESRRSI
jgi:hypothetical protein